MERNPKTETNPFLPQNLSGGDGGAKIYRLRLLLASSIDPWSPTSADPWRNNHCKDRCVRWSLILCLRSLVGNCQSLTHSLPHVRLEWRQLSTSLLSGLFDANTYVGVDCGWLMLLFMFMLLKYKFLVKFRIKGIFRSKRKIFKELIIGTWQVLTVLE